MIEFRKLFLVALLALAVRAEASKPTALTDAQKLEWKTAVQKALTAELSVHRMKEQAQREIARLQSEQEKATQEAQATAQRLLKSAGAETCELTLEGDVKCPPKPELKK